MRQVILQEFATLDGLAAGPNGNVDFVPAWTNGDASVDAYQLRFTDTIDTILLGRETYRMFSGYWPNTTSDDDPASDVLNQTPKIVFSKTLVSLARSLMTAGLIDQYKLVVCPVVLGGGTPLFDGGAAGLELKLLETQRFDRGAVGLTYAPAGR